MKSAAELMGGTKIWQDLYSFAPGLSTSAVSDEGFTCDNCREIVKMTEKVLELETRIQNFN